jgi:arginase family enzyme
MKRLSKLTDKIYIHIDMDVLDPKEVSGHSLNVPGGPTSGDLAAAIEVMFKYKKTSAFGIASYPHARDEDQLSLRAAYTLIKGAVLGIKNR